jgi:5-formyltetrahydrofolate cyclo-ligase
MSTDTLAAKAEMRASLRAQLKSLSREERTAQSEQACSLLQKQAVWRNSCSILFYSPLRDELDLSPLWEVAASERKIIALPRFIAEQNVYEARRLENHSQSLVPGRFGILEPKPECHTFPLNQLDLVLIPGVAFDLNGRRLGRGKGFYDRLLRQVCGTKCGAAFDQQIQPHVPAEPHDIYLNCILTPTRWLSFSQSMALK